MIKPTSPSLHGKIITFIMGHGFRIEKMKNAKLSKEFAMQLYKHVSQSLAIIIDYICSGEVIGLELVAPDAVAKWRKLLGATDPKHARPNTLRGMYGTDIVRNVAHGCETVEAAIQNADYFFGYQNRIPNIPFRATCQDCTCCIINPHVMIDGNVGQIFEMIASHEFLYISSMAMFAMKFIDAQEFYEIYKGVLNEYEDMSKHLAEGKCIVLEVKSKDPSKNCVTEFRKLCGPKDPELCRQLYPDTIRALYGKDIVHNAVHCTDLEEDGESEVEYFFRLVAFSIV